MFLVDHFVLELMDFPAVLLCKHSNYTVKVKVTFTKHSLQLQKNNNLEVLTEYS